MHISGKILFETNFCKTTWAEEENIMYVLWKEKTLTMHDDQFKEHLLSFAKFVQQYQVENIFVDTQLCFYTIGLNVQKWHDDVIVPLYLEGGLKKMAFLTSLDFYSQISHEQSFQEFNSRKLWVKFFDNADQAFKWLMNGLS